MQLGRIGVWSIELRFGDKAEGASAAAELDELGFGTIWVPGGIGGDVTGDLSHLLGATRRIRVASGIINIWKHEPSEIAQWFLALPSAQAERTMLGVGVSHGPVIGEAWVKPLAATRSWVERLIALGVPREHVCLAALGPKMLALSGELTAGAHPYLVTPEHSAEARVILGPKALLAPEQGVILESDPVRARKLGLGALEHYRHLPNYVNNWKRLGISQEDIDAGSDRLVDALFAWGDVGAIKARVDAHLTAGADHVCLQAITGGMAASAALPVWRALAAALL